jgi:hypothetical protein
MTVWAMLEQCVGHLDEPFRRSEIIGWFRRHYPDVKESTLGAHIQAATANATNRAQNNALGTRPPLLRRIDHGLYVRAGNQEEPAARRSVAPETPEPTIPDGADANVVLIGCVRTKRPEATVASELFASPLFEGRRRHAVTSGLPWYILSAKFGLLAPDDVIGPYDVYLAHQSLAYKTAWGQFVVAQLEQAEHDLGGRTIEVHAGAAYVDPLRAPLAARGASLFVPLAHLRQGEQLAWYSAPNREIRVTNAPNPPARTPEGQSDAAELVRLLSEPSQALTPQELLRRGNSGLGVPGLYSWWADEQGAADLSRGLGLPITSGLIYAGQAGATRWPSGKRSRNTLWGRITGMHLGAVAEFSTFRRTLAAILRPVLSLSSEDDPQLSAWINAHLRVSSAPVHDPDRLGMVEAGVLNVLDPPLNLSGRPPSAVRARLTQLRRGDMADSLGGSMQSEPQEQRPAEPSRSQTERKFHQAMVEIYETAKRELGYNAGRFLQMISEQGGVATAKQLLWSDQPSEGFTTLWEHHRLDLTVEAHVLLDEYAILFIDADRQQARDRLELYGWEGNL